MNTKQEQDNQLKGSSSHTTSNSIGSGNKGINKCGFSASLNGEQKIEMFKWPVRIVELEKLTKQIK